MSSSSEKQKICILSSFGDSEKNSYGNKIRNLKEGIYIETSFYQEKCDLIVCKYPSRGEKYLCGSVAGKSLVSPSYINDCRKSKSWLSVEQYEFHRVKKNPAIDPVLYNVPKLNKEYIFQNNKKLFQDWSVLLHVKEKNAKNAYRRLLNAGGGKIINATPPFLTNLKYRITHAFVTADSIDDLRILYRDKFLNILSPSYIAQCIVDANNVIDITAFRVFPNSNSEMKQINSPRKPVIPLRRSPHQLTIAASFNFNRKRKNETGTNTNKKQCFERVASSTPFFVKKEEECTPRFSPGGVRFNNPNKLHTISPHMSPINGNNNNNIGSNKTDNLAQNLFSNEITESSKQVPPMYDINQKKIEVIDLLSDSEDSIVLIPFKATKVCTSVINIVDSMAECSSSLLVNENECEEKTHISINDSEVLLTSNNMSSQINILQNNNESKIFTKLNRINTSCITDGNVNADLCPNNSPRFENLVSDIHLEKEEKCDVNNTPRFENLVSDIQLEKECAANSTKSDLEERSYKKRCSQRRSVPTEKMRLYNEKVNKSTSDIKDTKVRKLGCFIHKKVEKNDNVKCVTPLTSITNSTPQLESITKSTPQLESITKSTPQLESITKFTPQLESITKYIPQLESITKSTHQLESITKSTPQLERIAKSTLQLESITKSTPQLESITKTTPQLESITKSTPQLESIIKSTPQLERITKSTPQLESITKSTPQLESITKSTPKLECITSAPPRVTRRSSPNNIFLELGNNKNDMFNIVAEIERSSSIKIAEQENIYHIEAKDSTIDASNDMLRNTDSEKELIKSLKISHNMHVYFDLLICDHHSKLKVNDAAPFPNRIEDKIASNEEEKNFRAALHTTMDYLNSSYYPPVKVMSFLMNQLLSCKQTLYASTLHCLLHKIPIVHSVSNTDLINVFDITLQQPQEVEDSQCIPTIPSCEFFLDLVRGIVDTIVQDEKKTRFTKYKLLYIEYVVSVMQQNLQESKSEQSTNQTSADEMNKLLLWKMLWKNSKDCTINSNVKELIHVILNLCVQATTKEAYQLISLLTPLLALIGEIVVKRDLVQNGIRFGPVTTSFITELQTATAQTLFTASYTVPLYNKCLFINTLQPNWLAVQLLDFLLSRYSCIDGDKGLYSTQISLDKILKKYFFLYPNGTPEGSSKTTKLSTPLKDIKNHEPESKTSNRRKTVSLTKKNIKGESLLQVACIKNDPSRVRELLELGINPNMKDHAGWTALHEVSNFGYFNCLQELMKSSILDIYVVNNDGISALHDAAQYNHIKIAQMLLKKGGEKLLNLRTNSRKLLAADFATTPQMKALLSKGVDQKSVPLKHILDEGLYKSYPPLSCDVIEEYLYLLSKLVTLFVTMEECKVEKEETKQEISKFIKHVDLISKKTSLKIKIYCVSIKKLLI